MVCRVFGVAVVSEGARGGLHAVSRRVPWLFVCLVFMNTGHEGSDEKEVVYQGSAGYVIETMIDVVCTTLTSIYYKPQKMYSLTLIHVR